MNVLVELEVPKSCEECPFAYMTEGVSHDYCKYVGYETDIEDFTGSRSSERPRWCPFNNTETLRVLGEPSQCDPRHTELEDREYVSLAACAACKESEAAAKHDYDLILARCGNANLMKRRLIMAIEILKESDPKKVEAWDRIHDKRKLYRCERCGAEWKCEYHENKFGSKHELNGDPDIICQCCGYQTVKEVVLREMPEIVDDENCTTCIHCNLLYNPPVCRINGEYLPNPTGRFL